MNERPNLILIHTHDTGRYLGCYGAPVPTPHLSRLAREGILFRKAFSVSPVCSPSRVGLMTSLFPHNSGMVGLAHQGFKMKNPKFHLANLLRESGYRTQLIGFQHECHKKEVDCLGYDEVVPKDQFEFHSVQRAKYAADWIQNAPTQPFFLNVGLSEAHRPFLPAEAADDPRYVAPLPWLPDCPEVRQDIAELHTAVRHIDESVGYILDAIDRNELTKNTLVIFTTDHGLAFHKAKSSLFDAGTGVSLIMRGPQGFEGGKVIDEMVTHLDILPTFFEMTGVPIPGNAQGKSLQGLVNGTTSSVHHEIYAEHNHHEEYDPARAIRTSRYKYIRFFKENPRTILSNVDPGRSKQYFIEQGLPVGKRPCELLFDLVNDPHEFENVIEWPEYASVRNDLRQRLQNWMEQTEDPILEGPVPSLSEI
jgi:N-sulfoglucosamine sulfohydrolase